MTTFPLEVNMLPLPGIAKESGIGTCKFQSRHLLDKKFLFVLLTIDIDISFFL